MIRTTSCDLGAISSPALLEIHRQARADARRFRYVLSSDRRAVGAAMRSLARQLHAEARRRQESRSCCCDPPPAAPPVLVFTGARDAGLVAAYFQGLAELALQVRAGLDRQSEPERAIIDVKGEAFTVSRFWGSLAAAILAAPVAPEDISTEVRV